MSWQFPLYIGLLYFCLGLAILNSTIFNSGLDLAVTATTTDTVPISTPNPQTPPTRFAAGYLPYKIPALPWLDNMEAVEIEDFGKEGEHKQQVADTRDQTGDTDLGDLPDCQIGKKSCLSLGHPEICCNESHTCLPTNNTLTGVYCCRSPDPTILPCDDTNLKCELGWYQCSASVNGGCCKHGQTCGLLECYDGGEHTTPTANLAPVTTLFNPGIYGSGIKSNEDNTTIERTSINVSRENKTVTVTSKSTVSKASAIEPTDSPKTTAKNITISRAIDNSVSVTYMDHNHPRATGASAAGSRAKVGRHWSLAVMVWWIIAAIVEGL